MEKQLKQIQVGLRFPEGKSLTVGVNLDTKYAELVEMIEDRMNIKRSQFFELFRMQTLGGLELASKNSLHKTVFEHEQDGFFEINIKMLVVGGKGGFGSMLRAQGGKMSSAQTSNFDSCRDLTGRRLIVVRAAKSLAQSAELAKKEENSIREKRKKKIEKALIDPAPKKVKFDYDEFGKQKENITRRTRELTKKALTASTTDSAKDGGNAESSGGESGKSSVGVDPTGRVPALSLFGDDLEGISDCSSGSDSEGSED